MKISELAGRTDTTTKTLRFYEDAGLIPKPPRAANGYRDYDPTIITRIQFIKAGQAVGLTLAEIRDILTIRDDGRAPCNAAIELLDAQLRDITQRIRELRALKRDLAQLRERALDLDPADCAPDSVCHIINPGPCTCESHSLSRAAGV
jgi:DNA-binding transcriptional MerR regulator